MRNKMLSLDVGKLICIELNIDFPSCYVYLQNVWSIYYNNVRESIVESNLTTITTILSKPLTCNMYEHRKTIIGSPINA